MTQNETAVNLYQLGFFNPEMAGQALIALGMMSFEGKDEIVRKISEQAMGSLGIAPAAPAAASAFPAGNVIANTQARAASLGNYAEELARRANTDIAENARGAEPV